MSRMERGKSLRVENQDLVRKDTLAADCQAEETAVREGPVLGRGLESLPNLLRHSQA